MAQIENIMKVNLFSKELYPTPPEVIARMMQGEDFINKTILEPSAGTGNIVSWLQDNGAGRVVAAEIDSRLRTILSGKCEVIGTDFLQMQSHEVSHVNMIVMNPPFSNADEHILHAWAIAPQGCTIIALCNTDTVEYYRSTRNKKMLSETIRDNGNVERLGRVFTKSERTTDVCVSLVKLYKPGSGDNEFAGFFTDEVDAESLNPGVEGIMPYNAVRDIVNRYVTAVQKFDEVDRISDEINSITADNSCFHIRFGAYTKDSGQYSNPRRVTREQFKNELQKASWRWIFSKLNMERFVTKSVREKINQLVESQQAVPFTMKNVYRLLDMLVQTHGQRMQTTLEEAFDKICSFSAENSTAGETWKTNSNYMINRKFIVPGMTDYDARWPREHVRLGYYGYKESIEDIHLALCHLTGTPPPTKYEERFQYIVEHQDLPWGEWGEWGFFRIKGFKKGTMHFEFKDEEVWAKFNQAVASARGWQVGSTSKSAKNRNKQ